MPSLDIASRIELAPDRPWTLDTGILQLAGIALNPDPVLRLRGRDEAYFEQLRAEVPSVASAMDARRRRVTGAPSETVPGVEGDERAELYADFIRAWRRYVGQRGAPGWDAVLSEMWHAIAWGWRPARLSWSNVPGGEDVRPMEWNGRRNWRVPYRIQPLRPELYAWTAEGELVEMIVDGGALQAALLFPRELDAVSHWHVRAGGGPSPYGVGFMRYAEGPSFARRVMWMRYQSGVNAAMGGWLAKQENITHLPSRGTGQAGGAGEYAGQLSSLIAAFRLLEETRVLVVPDGWKLSALEGGGTYNTNWLEGIAYVDKFLSMMIRGSLVSEIGGTSAPGSRAAAETLNDGLEGAVAADDAKLLQGNIACLDRVVLEANFGRIPDHLLPREVIHAGPRAPVADVATLAGASAAAGVEPDWEQLYRSMGIPFRTVEPLVLDDNDPTLPAPVAGVIPRLGPSGPRKRCPRGFQKGGPGQPCKRTL